MATDREVLHYVVWVKGLFGRNRKIKYATFRIAESTPDKPLSLDDLLPKFRAKLAAEKFRGGYAGIEERPVTETEHDLGDGRTAKTESFMLFSGRELHRERLDAPGLSFT